MGGGGHKEQFSREPLPVFSAGGPCEQYWQGQGCPHSLILSIPHFLCRSRHRPPSKVPLRMFLERLMWRVTCPNCASYSPLHARNLLEEDYSETKVSSVPYLGSTRHIGKCYKDKQVLRRLASAKEIIKCRCFLSNKSQRTFQGGGGPVFDFSNITRLENGDFTQQAY